MNTYRLVFEMLPPNANAYARMHWRVRHETLQMWTGYAQALRAAFVITQPLDKFEIEATFYVHRLRDLDNLTAMLKMPIDALRHAGIIANDNPKHLVKLDADQRQIYKLQSEFLEMILREVRDE